MRLLLILFLLPLMVFSQQKIPEGTKLVELANSQESFLEFVPENYDSNILWPAIFVFDPGGNAINGITPFLNSAREMGYLVFASNDAQNGKHTENFDIAGRMMNQAIASYSIDGSRMYVAGFSGGSRLASAIAVLSKQMAGVIACGSGFSPNVNEQPTNETFSYAGIVGNSDMNYAEMHAAHAWLDKFDVTNRLFLFEGGHRWPSPSTIKRAMVWLDMNKAKNLNEELLATDRRYGDSLVSQENWLMAYKEFEAMRDGDPPSVQRQYAMDQLTIIRQQAGLEESVRDEKQLLARENKMLNELTDRYLGDLKKPNKSSVKWWEKRIAQLAESSGDLTPQAQQSARLIRHIQAIALESGFVDQNHKDSYQKALFSARLLLLTDPESSYYHYLEIYAHEAAGQRKLALEQLESAFSKGQLNAKEFTKYRLHEKLKDDPQYQGLIERYSAD